MLPKRQTQRSRGNCLNRQCYQNLRHREVGAIVWTDNVTETSDTEKSGQLSAQTNLPKRRAQRSRGNCLDRQFARLLWVWLFCENQKAKVSEVKLYILRELKGHIRVGIKERNKVCCRRICLIFNHDSRNDPHAWEVTCKKQFLTHPSVYGRIILRWIFRKLDGRMSWIYLA